MNFLTDSKNISRISHAMRNNLILFQNKNQVLKRDVVFIKSFLTNKIFLFHKVIDIVLLIYFTYIEGIIPKCINL